MDQDLKQSLIAYNDDPVHYCSECLSLRIRTYDEATDYCEECGNTDVHQAHITEWEKMYEEKYKKKFINKK